MKKILITGGSTNEPVDEVMRLITFGSGGTSVKLGNLFIIDILFNEFCSRNLDVVIRNKQATHEASIPMFVTKD